MQHEVFLVYAHLISIIGTASLLVAELFACRVGIRGEALHRLKKVDIGYAVFAVLALATGATLVFFGAKGSSYYLHNALLHTKFTIYVVVAALSIMPTVRFIQWSSAAQRDTGFAPAPNAVSSMRQLLWIELVLLAAMPLLGTSIAHGLTRFSQFF